MLVVAQAGAGERDEDPRRRGAGDAVLDAVSEYADGWLPIGGSGLAEAIERLRRKAVQRGRPADALSVVPFGSIPDSGKLAHFVDLGIDEVILRARNAPRDELLRELDGHARFLEQVAG